MTSGLSPTRTGRPTAAPCLEAGGIGWFPVAQAPSPPLGVAPGRRVDAHGART